MRSGLNGSRTTSTTRSAIASRCCSAPERRHGHLRGKLPMTHRPGSTWNYSSGTTNIICRIFGEAVGGGREGMETFLRTRLFEPTGMSSAIPKFDTSGTFVGSSYVYATARDFARFGELYRTTVVVDRRVLPAGWRDDARTLRRNRPEDGFGYGRHWWLWPDLPGSLACHGYEGSTPSWCPTGSWCWYTSASARRSRASK